MEHWLKLREHGLPALSMRISHMFLRRKEAGYPTLASGRCLVITNWVFFQVWSSLILYTILVLWTTRFLGHIQSIRQYSPCFTTAQCNRWWCLCGHHTAGNHSTIGFPVLHYLLESAQNHVHWVDDAIQASHSLSPPSPLLKSTSLKNAE